MDAPCGCAREPHRIGTCEACLPQGAIELLIDGVQADLFLDAPEPSEASRVYASMRGHGTDGTVSYVLDPSEVLRAIRLEDSSF